MYASFAFYVFIVSIFFLHCRHLKNISLVCPKKISNRIFCRRGKKTILYKCIMDGKTAVASHKHSKCTLNNITGEGENT